MPSPSTRRCRAPSPRRPTSCTTAHDARRASVDYRQLGSSGLKVSTLTLGTMGFGGGGKFAKVGEAQVDEAREQVDLCLEAGVNLIDTADVYSDGVSEEIVG